MRSGLTSYDDDDFEGWGKRLEVDDDGGSGEGERWCFFVAFRQLNYVLREKIEMEKRKTMSLCI